MASQKTLFLLVVLVSAAFEAHQASDLRRGTGQGKHKRVGGRTSVDQNDEPIQLPPQIDVGDGIVGEYTPVDPSDVIVQLLAQFAVEQICSDYVVENAEMQVVAGTNYRMDILVSKAWKCKVVVFAQFWTNTLKLTSFACESVL
ncbi:hypothetical protein DPMN_037956 [Dreissena polymorpha]|uniref:Cystatin domain-containing protein n=1 Tax=Dreissena polymorpha TaxID=45954 RepID=A0A9D4MDN6_DREPO|nr:hypothetical protein DPMN_037956 [Dreissena polymorpha]